MKFYPKQTDTFESKRGKLQLGPTGKLSSFPTKVAMQLCATEADFISPLWKRARLSLIPRHWEDRPTFGRALGHYSMEGILWRWHWLEAFPVLPLLLQWLVPTLSPPSARGDHSFHRSAFCSISQTRFQAWAHRQLDRHGWGWRFTTKSWQHSLLTPLLMVLHPSLTRLWEDQQILFCHYPALILCW